MSYIWNLGLDCLSSTQLDDLLLIYKYIPNQLQAILFVEYNPFAKNKTKQ